MKKRKKIILDKKFQLKTTFSIIGITSIIVTIIIGLISYNMANNNNKLSNIIVIQKNVVEALLTYSQENQSREDRILINNISKSHDKNISNIQNIIELNYKFLFIIIIVSVFQCIILFLILIKKTHKISGPIYVMSKYIDEIINGNFPKTRPLRKGDELKEIYDLFIKMIDTLAEREKSGKEPHK
jgi:nitrogen fixation/metabolism regulation signal transduction histidine kinase